jgi:ATP-dependent exoDNAse (exonuclease V) alpha subunit
MEEVKNLERDKFLELFAEGESLFLTGRAGTGKSTLIRELIQKSGKKMIVLAPTGVAAINLRAKTIHSFFQFPLRPILPNGDRAIKRLNPRKKKIIAEAEAIVIDEISMVRADLLDAIDQSLRLNTGSKKPFAGKQMIFVGDLFQLKPVITNRMGEKDIIGQHYKLPAYFFDAYCYRMLKPKIVELKHVYRQAADQDFLAILDRIRVGNHTKDDLDILNQKFARHYQGDEIAIELCTTNQIVNDINQRKLEELDTPVVYFEAEVEDNFEEKLYPTHYNLMLKQGAQVMFIKNGEDYVNGTLGKITYIDAATVEVELETGEVIQVEPTTWDNIEYEFDDKKNQINGNTIGTFTQYPLKLAWAITIHKSQGLTFNNLYLNLGFGAFDTGQTYVALSRCTSLEGLLLRRRIRNIDVKVDPRVVEFWDNNLYLA